MHKLAFLIPHYNHGKNIDKLLSILKKYGAFILIVDDGSNAENRAILEKIDAKVIYREQNGGKGAAVKTGFNFLVKSGFTHAFQIDADMQHDLAEVENFIKASKENPQYLICANPLYDKNAPKSRLYGRKITNFWVSLNTLSLDIKDSMCGFRIYPLNAVKSILANCKSDRMEFDIDIFYLLFKFGVKFTWIDVFVFYDSNGISHFNAFKDNLLISKIHAKHFFDLPRYIFKRLSRG